MFYISSRNGSLIKKNFQFGMVTLLQCYATVSIFLEGFEGTGFVDMH